MSENEQKYISVPNLAKRGEVSKSWVGNQCRDSSIPSVHMRNRWFVSMDWVLSKEKESEHVAEREWLKIKQREV